MGKQHGNKSGPTSATNANAASGTPTPNSTVQYDCEADISTVAIQVLGTYTGALSVQATVNGTDWVTLGGTQIVNVATGTGAATIPSATPGIYRVNVAGFKAVRVTALAAVTGAPNITILGT